MFTVKFRDSDINGGVETIYSAETIEVVPPGPAKMPADATNQPTSNWDEAGIFLDREAPPAPNENRPRFSKHIILFGSDHSLAGQARMGGKVWIMNAEGATVASYEL